MDKVIYTVFLAVSFFASVVGSICGIGGGVIIKPVLDLLGIMDITTISFLSGCTVLAMSLYSVIQNKLSGKLKKSGLAELFLAFGGAVGGIAGKILFQEIKSLFKNPDTVGAVQAFCLIVLTFGTLFYTLFKSRIKTYHIRSMAVCLIIGLILGILSSFLGIGGGPINLVILYFFFSMTTKEAASGSLYIICFSQISSLAANIVSGSVPKVDWRILAGMILCGLLGGITGRFFNKKINDKIVERLFIGLMVLIVLINIYNVYRYI